jgi:hypothetical protein
VKKKNKLLLVFAVMMLFVSLVAAIFFSVKTGLIPFQLGLLLFISLLAMYMGFGILIGAYRLVNKLN